MNERMNYGGINDEIVVKFEDASKSEIKFDTLTKNIGFEFMRFVQGICVFGFEFIEFERSLAIFIVKEGLSLESCLVGFHLWNVLYSFCIEKF